MDKLVILTTRGFNNVVRKDVEFELRQEAQDLQLGVKPINEVREDRGLDPVPWGDKPLDLKPPKLAPESDPSNPEEGPKEPKEEQ